MAIQVLAVGLLTLAVLGTAACDSGSQDLFNTMTEGEWRLDIRTGPPFPERYGVAYAKDGTFSSWYSDDMGTHESEGKWDLAKGTGGKTLLLITHPYLWTASPGAGHGHASLTVLLTAMIEPRLFRASSGASR